MFSGRRKPLRDPVTLTLDGAEIQAERGEPIAQALLAADKSIVARSPKLHRPRGPSCFRGGCDGCLARVDGVPNVMTCLVRAKGGERVESQNVIGARKADLLRVTDWFFPKGIDHHHLMAGVPGLQDVMQSFAQKVAGLGRLPASVTLPQPAARIAIDVAIVGGGISGLTVASHVRAAGFSALVVDDGIALGGALLGDEAALAPMLAAKRLEGVEFLSAHTAGGVYDGELLVASIDRAAIVRARALVFATGAHDGMIAVPGNDLPGVFSARALCRLLAAGLAPDGPVAIVGDGFWADALAARVGKKALRFKAETITGFDGTGGVKAVRCADGSKHAVAAVGLALAGAPAFELAEQAGAKTRHRPAGYAVDVDATGRAGAGLFAVGECTGAPFDPPALRAQAVHVANAVAVSLR
jgi:sarcosine oxidase subunit alpha